MPSHLSLTKLLTLPIVALLALFSLNSEAKDTDSIKVIQITPTGSNITASRQITIKFNKNLVSLGDMRRKSEQIPIKISPSLNCQWQWLTRNTLACQLSENDRLSLATKYTLIIKKSPLNEKGETLEKTHTHIIETERPKLRQAQMYEIKERGKPIHQLYFNQKVTKKSVARSLKYQYEIEGKTKNISVKVDDNSPENRLNDVHNARKKTIKNASQWFISPRQALPKNTEIKLVALAGLSTANGRLRSKEAKTALEFQSFNDFRFIGISCANTDYKTIDYTLSELDRAKCNPQSSVTLNFSSPINSHALYQRLGAWRDTQQSDQLNEAWKDNNRWTRVYQHHIKGQFYPVHIPANFLPNETIEIRALDNLLKKASIKDMLGQSIKNDIKASFLMRDYTPNINIEYQDVVLEKGISSDAAATVVNLKSISFDYKTSTGNSGEHKKKLNFSKNQLATTPLGIRDLINNKGGVVIGTFSADPKNTKGQSLYRPLFAQVTPFQVHAKMGHYSSLVWVTDLATGKVIKNTEVEILGSTNNTASEFKTEVLEKSITNNNGIAKFKGLNQLDPRRAFSNRCYNLHNCKHMYVRVSNAQGSALLPIRAPYHIYTRKVSNNSVNSDRRTNHGLIKAWGTSAQGIYRPGDTIQYKIYVRDQSNTGITVAPDGPYRLYVEDPNGQEIHEREEITLSEFGGISGEINLAKAATMGEYTFVLEHEFDHGELYPLSVLVTDFTPAPFKLSQKLNGSLFTPMQELVVDIDASLHSGGPYANTTADVEIEAKRSDFSPNTPITKGFTFNNHDHYHYYYRQNLLSETIDIDSNGHGQASLALPLLDDDIVSANIIVQAIVEDERGKSIVSRSKADYLSVDRLVGLKSDKWVFKSGEPATLKALVVDAGGIAVSGSDIEIKILSDNNLQEDTDDTAINRDQWNEVADCSIISSNEASECSFTPELSGSYKFVATIKDTQGRQHSASKHIWVSGRSRVYWASDHPNSLELVSDKDRLKVGDTARYLVKNPYPGAEALITIERYGVIDSWQQTLDGSTPVIEFKVKKNYAPGVYVSVVVSKPRTGHDIPKEGEPDAHQPNYKIGYQKLNITDSQGPLEIDIKTDLDVYKPGDTVTLTLKPKNSKILRQNDIELAISVLDEAVLDLVKGNTNYFDLYKGFYTLDSLDLENYNILNALVGLQKFTEPLTEKETQDLLKQQLEGAIFHAPSVRLESKIRRDRDEVSASAPLNFYAASESSLEEVVVTSVRKSNDEADEEIKEVKARDNLVDNAHWQDNVKVNEDGTVTIKFKLPDNLTGWRVLVVATTPNDAMGLSHHNFKVNQLTEIRPVMPNQVTEKDQFNAGFSVLNRSEEQRHIKVKVRASGNTNLNTPFEKTIELAPHARETVFIPMSASNVTSKQEHGIIDYVITAGDSLDADALKHSVPVNRRKNLSTFAIYGSTVGKSILEDISIPQRISPDLGGISVQMSPTIINNVSGAFEYMKRYPYACWEQKLTKAVMASHFKILKPYVSDEITWPKSQDLSQETLDIAINSQAPNGGMTYFRAENQYVSPYLSAYTALAFTWLNDAGYEVPNQVQEKLTEYLNTVISPKTKLGKLSNNAASTVQAVAIAALAKSGDLSRSNLMHYFSKSQTMSLFGKAQLLDAMKQFSNTETEQRDLLNQILAFSNSSAGKITFNENLDASFVRLHSSPIRSQCAILDSLSNNNELLVDKDMPSNLVQNIVAKRGGRSHWENTQDNVYCLNALSRYAKVYEADEPMIQSTVKFGNESFGTSSFKGFKSPATTLKLAMRNDLIGKDEKLSIEHNGKGRLYYKTQLQFSELDEPLQRDNAGMDIRRERSVFRNDAWQLIQAGEKIHRGETVRTDLFLSVPAERHFVAVRDPMPGGLEPINSDLANNGQSLKIADNDHPSADSYYYKKRNWQGFSYSPWGFYHKELGHDAVTFYSDYVAKGEYHLSYLSQAIATGEFLQQVVHAEEMYHPDVYGKGLSSKLIIVE